MNFKIMMLIRALEIDSELDKALTGDELREKAFEMLAGRIGITEKRIEELWNKEDLDKEDLEAIEAKLKDYPIVVNRIKWMHSDEYKEKVNHLLEAVELVDKYAEDHHGTDLLFIKGELLFNVYSLVMSKGVSGDGSFDVSMKIMGLHT